MNFPLAIIGRGAVSAAGIGVEALRTGRPEPVIQTSLRNAKLLWPVLRVDPKAPELARWQREPRLRRASPLTHFLIEAAEQALAGVAAPERAETGLVVALSAGCLIYTRRFFDEILSSGRKMASPALFPETVFNSPGSHVAATLKLNGAASVLVGDESAWLAALRTASVWLARGRVRQVLLLGGEEFDRPLLDAYRSARWFGRPGVAGARGFMPGEGAAALLVRAAAPGDRAVIAEIHDGFLHRHPAEAKIAAEKLSAVLDPKRPVWRTASHTWLEPLEEKLAAGRVAPASEKAIYLGQAFTASAGWHLIRAAQSLSAAEPELTVPLWGLTHQLGALVLRPGGTDLGDCTGRRTR